MPQLPNVGGAVMAWGRQLDFVVMGKEQVDYKTVEVPYAKKAFGTRQPLRAQELAIKPEGQRSWKWEALWLTPSIELKPDDILVFGDTRYRIMGKEDFSEYGYIRYEMVQDYQT